MRIIHIIPNLKKGGAERLVTDIVRELSTHQGIIVRLVIFRNEIEYEIEDIRQLVHIIPSSVQLSLLRKNKINVQALQLFINDFKPDVIHSHLFEAEIVSRSCLYPKAKWFSHCHGNMAQFENFSIHTLINKKLFTNFIEKVYLFKQYAKNKNNHFFAISTDTYLFAKKTCKNYPITKLVNATDIIKYKRNQSHQNDKIRIINIGSFVENKNQKLLISIAKTLAMHTKDFVIIMLGNGVNRESIKKQITQNNLDNYFILPGSVENVLMYLDKSNIYVHTSKFEAFGLVLVEAMANSLPVIALDGKGNRELIEEGKNGFMILEENPNLFVEKILFLHENKNEFERISNYAKEFAKRFDIKIFVTKLIEIYLK